MASNTKYQPGSSNQYSAADLNLDFKGYSFTCTKNSTTDCDMQITDDSLIDGGRVVARNIVYGDKVTCQVVDKDNILGLGAGTVLKQFVTNWYMPPGDGVAWDFSANYPAKLLTGLYVRVKYTSVGTTNDVDLCINLRLHKILW